MKKVKTVLLGVVILTILGVVSCKKRNCYRCYDYYCYIIASKGGDTVNYGNLYTPKVFQDTINHLISLGYVIDTARGGYIHDPPGGAEVCDTNAVYIGQPVRDSCAIII